MTTNLELYEALKPTVGEEAAKMIAEVIPLGRDIATKDDIAQLESRLGAQIARLETRMLRLMLTFFVPMWVTILAALVAVVLKA